ncbi:hypothetical protein [Pseudomonas taetrolens]|uniref:hypothetical protein n=1 Tax=Pseudomonas taetrolens TaxID=47884 RepID=UPI0030D7DD88
MSYKINPGLSAETKVFRYMDLAKFLSLIHQKTIFFAKASSYEDSLEGMPTELDRFLGSESAELLDVTINLMWAGLATDVDDEIRKRNREEANRAKLDHENRNVNTIFGPLKTAQDFGYSSIVKAVSNWVDISCWHTDASDVESMAMWKIYGGGSASVCVESTVGDVLSAMSIPPELNVIAGVVTYIDYQKDYVGIDEPIRFFFNKSKHYEFEKELRFVLRSVQVDDVKASRVQPGTSVAVDPKVLIKGVMVSPTASNWFVELIGLVMRSSGYSVTVSKSKISVRNA